MNKVKTFWLKLRRNPFYVVLGLFIVLVVSVISYALSGKDNLKSKWQPVYSTYYTDETGVQAYYDLLKQTGIPVKQWRRSYQKLDSVHPMNLISLNPVEDYRIYGQEPQALLKRIEKGGNFIYASDRNGGVLQKLGIKLDRNKKMAILSQKEDVMLMNPSFWFDNVTDVDLTEVKRKSKFDFEMPMDNGEDYWISDSLPIIPYMGTESGGVKIGTITYGKGHIFLFSRADIFTNSGIKRKKNAQLLVNLAQNIYLSNQSPILFDECYQGFCEDNLDKEEKWSPFTLPQARYVLWGMTLLFILFCYSEGKRVIKAVKVYEAPRRRVMEYVEAMANLYEKKKTYSYLFEEVYHRFRRSLVHYLALPQHVSNEEIIQKYTKKNAQAEEVAFLTNLLNRCETLKNQKNIIATTKAIQEMRIFCNKHKIEHFNMNSPI